MNDYLTEQMEELNLTAASESFTKLFPGYQIDMNSLFNLILEGQAGEAFKMITQAVIANGETVMETVKNPAYLTGISRTVYQNILDFLPAGQAVQIFNQGVLNLGKMMGYSILIIFGTSLAGLYLFNRKDIK